MVLFQRCLTVTGWKLSKLTHESVGKHMLDKSIPYKNIIMRADSFSEKKAFHLPQGFSCKAFSLGDEPHWAEVEASVGEFDSSEEALVYFEKKYLPELENLKQRCRFIIAPDGSYAATCTAWTGLQDSQTIGALHWLAVRPEYQRKGLARVLVQEIMQIFNDLDEFPVYLHTQTWSHAAVLLYCHAGFRILKFGSFDDSANDYSQAMAILKDAVTPEAYTFLLRNSV